MSAARTASALALCMAALGLQGCALWPFAQKGESAPAPKAEVQPTSTSITPGELVGAWQCAFDIAMGPDSARFDYTDQFHPDGALRAQAHLVYDMPSTGQQHEFVVQGEGHWRMQGNTITLIVPRVVRQDRSARKRPELLRDKDLVPEDLSDTWTVQSRQGNTLRVLVGSLADTMLCHRED